MFEPLFPNWSDPTALVTLLGLRLIFNSLGIALAARLLGKDSPVTLTLAVLTLTSTTIAVLALRPGIIGLAASYLELLLQIVILVGVSYAVYTSPSKTRLAALAVILIGSTALLLIMIPLYGEAFVAP